jgi:ribosome-associated protein
MVRGARFVRVSPELEIPWSELEFHASRAGGPGGQHVNRASTRVEVRWNIRRSATLSAAQRTQLLDRLAARLDRHGRLRLVSGARRSQAMNRAAVVDRLARLVAAALAVAPERKPTRPTAASVERRLREKRHRAALKRERRAFPADE